MRGSGQNRPLAYCASTCSRMSAARMEVKERAKRSYSVTSWFRRSNTSMEGIVLHDDLAAAAEVTGPSWRDYLPARNEVGRAAENVNRGKRFRNASRAWISGWLSSACAQSRGPETNTVSR